MFSTDKHYQRFSNILYENGVPRIKFSFSAFIDIEDFNEQGIDYMSRYCSCWPEYWEVITLENSINLIILIL